MRIHPFTRKMTTREISCEKRGQVLLSFREVTKVSQWVTGNINYLTAVNDGVNHHLQFCTAYSLLISFRQAYLKNLTGQ